MVDSKAEAGARALAVCMVGELQDECRGGEKESFV